MTRNTMKTPRVANIKVSSGTASTLLKVTQGPSSIEIMDKSQVKDFDKYYKPQEFNFDMLRNDAKWSWFRCKQSEHFFVFWDAYFGDDPNSSSLAEADRIDVDDLLQKAEHFYETNITRLGMVVTGQGKSQLDKYKMEIYLLDPTPEWWVATGSGYDNVIGALWVTPSTCKPVGSVIAHEIGHHVEYLTGILGKAHQEMSQLSKAKANQVSVRLELLADYYAGVWAHYEDQMNHSMEYGDLEKGLELAKAIGDDWLQKKAQGRATPESFTHGTSDQRKRWLKRGFETGDMRTSTFDVQNYNDL